MQGVYIIAQSLGKPTLSTPIKTIFIVGNKQASSLSGRCSLIPQSYGCKHNTEKCLEKKQPWGCILGILSDNIQGRSELMVDCLAQQCPSPISACQNSIHFQMTFCSRRFPQSPVTILPPFLLCFLIILTYSPLLCPQLYLPYQQSANTLRVGIGPFPAFQAQIVCIQQVLTPYFLSWRD